MVHDDVSYSAGLAKVVGTNLRQMLDVIVNKFVLAISRSLPATFFTVHPFLLPGTGNSSARLASTMIGMALADVVGDRPSYPVLQSLVCSIDRKLGLPHTFGCFWIANELLEFRFAYLEVFAKESKTAVPINSKLSAFDSHFVLPCAHTCCAAVWINHLFKLTWAFAHAFLAFGVGNSSAIMSRSTSANVLPDLSSNAK
jgi:hypothetical protein